MFTLKKKQKLCYCKASSIKSSSKQFSRKQLSGFLKIPIKYSILAPLIIFLMMTLMVEIVLCQPQEKLKISEGDDQKQTTNSESNKKEEPSNKTTANQQLQQTNDLIMPEGKQHPLLKRAENHYFKKRYNIALKLLKKILEEDPENITAYLYTGDIYLIQQNYGLAEEQFQIARELSKNPAQEWFRLGQTRFLRKDSKGALNAFLSSLKSQPSMFINHFYIGMVYYHLLRNKKETITAWEKFRLLKPQDPQGPAIDRALIILKKKDFVFPAMSTDPCIQVPTARDTRVPYKPGKNEKEKTNNDTETIMEIDDL